MFLLLIGVMFALGALLGSFTRIPLVILAVPPLVLAVAYWVVVGWNGDDYDIGRSGLVLVTAIVGGIFVSVWVVGSVVGRLVRLGFEGPPSSRQAGS
jgi:hypothetical protein